MYKYKSQGILKPFFYEPAKHLMNLFFDLDYRKYSKFESKIRKIPRHKEFNLKLEKYNLEAPDSASFLSSYKEIFLNKIYNFNSDTDKPYIIDVGANIGLSVIFFKMLYPNSKIIAFEADPYIFKFLEKNIHGNGFTDVILVNKAAWFEDSIIKFSSDKADGGKISNNQNDNLIAIDAVDISPYLEVKNIDFLKIDIEGAEEVVLPACKKYLPNVKHLFVEYHSSIDQKQFLDKIISIISDSGFRIHIQVVHSSESPFVDLKLNDNFDLQLNIFGLRKNI